MHIGILDIVLRVGLTLATSFLFGIMFLGYWRTRTRKMLFVTAGFAVFARACPKVWIELWP